MQLPLHLYFPLFLRMLINGHGQHQGEFASKSHLPAKRYFEHLSHREGLIQASLGSHPCRHIVAFPLRAKKAVVQQLISMAAQPPQLAR